jgi:C1A family cysteine protease
MPTANKSTSVRRYGWRPSLPDQRDLYLRFSPHQYDKLTQIDHVDLSDGMPPCYDQGDLGSCVAHAVAGGLQFDEIKQKKVDQTTPSRLFIYWNARYLDPYASTDEDSGSTITMGLKAVRVYGFANETLWPYDVPKFRIEAPKNVYTSAVQGRISNYARVNQTTQDIQLTLANGNAVLFGFSIYQSFQSQAVADSGIVPMPRHHERLLGGHAVVAVGYDNATQRFKVRNSWGPDWGQGGYFTIPYAYLLNQNLSSDFWVINAIP